MGWKIIIASAAFGLLALSTSAYATPATVTVDQVLANSAFYEGKPVRVHGFATFEFENNRIWRDEAAFRTYERERSLYIDTTGLSQATRDEAKGRLTYVTGTFKSRDYTLALMDVTSVQRDPSDHGPDRGWWSDPDFTTLFIVLSALGFVIALTFGARGQGLALQPGWKSRKPMI